MYKIAVYNQANKSIESFICRTIAASHEQIYLLIHSEQDKHQTADLINFAVDTKSIIKLVPNAETKLIINVDIIVSIEPYNNN